MGNGEQSLDCWMKDLERRRTFAKPEHAMRGFFFKGLLASHHSGDLHALSIP